MNPIEVNETDVLAAEKMVATDAPIAMLNLVTFNPVAMYEDPSVEACSGREAYLQRYAPAFKRWLPRRTSAESVCSTWAASRPVSSLSPINIGMQLH